MRLSLRVKEKDVILWRRQEFIAKGYYWYPTQSDAYTFWWFKLYARRKDFSPSSSVCRYLWPIVV